MMKTAKEYFNASATKWDKPMRVALAQAVAESIKNNVNLSATMNAMEFGCGTGLISMRLALMLKSVLAVDMSENMLAALQEKITENQVQNIIPAIWTWPGGAAAGTV
ncbi:MAG: methyltransferase domain-containing protein [Desulfobacterales bacterium]